MTRALAIAVLLACASGSGPAPAQAQSSADLDAEARVYFERGNRRLERAMQSGGKRKHRLLDEALQSYIESLRIVRSRNAVFNAALTLEELERLDEAFAYYTEYLGMPGLSEEARAEAERRRDALRDRVAVVAVESEPPGAEVQVDRLDLSVRGTTPLEMALPPGEHTLFVTKPHYERATVPVTAEVGERVPVRVELEPEPVRVRVVTPASNGRLRVDGQPAERGAAMEMPPGRHTVRLELGGRRAVEREIEVPVGGEPMTVRLEPPPPATGELAVHTNVPAAVRVDGERVGRGRRIEAELREGEHEVVVGAPGRAPWSRRVRVEAGRTAALRVRLAPEVEEGKRFGRIPAGLGVASGVLSVVTLGLAIHAGNRHDDLEAFQKARCPGDPPLCETSADLERLRDLDRDVHRANVATDVFLWTTVGLGVTTIVLAILNRDREQPPSTGSLNFTPTPGGAMVGVRWPFGGGGPTGAAPGGTP